MQRAKRLARDDKPLRPHSAKSAWRFRSARISALATVLRHFSGLVGGACSAKMRA
jgi:hypothetical protein